MEFRERGEVEVELRAATFVSYSIIRRKSAGPPEAPQKNTRCRELPERFASVMVIQTRSAGEKVQLFLFHKAYTDSERPKNER
jgi:hypothetical protein